MLVGIKEVVGRLYHSPIVRAFTLFVVLTVLAMQVLSYGAVIQFLISCTIAGGSIVLVRFARDVWEAVQEPRPQPEDWWLMGGYGIALSIVTLRLTNLFQLELGANIATAFMIGSCNVILVFSLFLKGWAPPFDNRIDRDWDRISPLGVLAMILVFGGCFELLLAGLRWLL